MKIIEVLNEVAVQSSWIVDVRKIGRNTYFINSDGSRYRVIGCPTSVYREWLAAPSKGKFFHNRIKYHYKIVRKI